ncbi:NmrA family protein [Caballeronia udeis]|uniref:NmrA family protein n=1 Tax=Caballeronia udeis TaxID=1232866 RepID=A0A158FI61_9BURK|nr:NAD(P)H-binding protein [Caballeronia udeis]SAL19009.1 NmrA family protein [Caballeronia udeis]
MFVIFGASGKVGRVSAASLRNAGHAVRAVVRNEAQGELLARMGCEIALADLTNPVSVARAMEGADAVQILCPVPMGDAQPGSTMRRMIEVAADALRANPPPHVLALSDYGAELDQGTGITLLFHILEKQLQAAVQNLTLLRAAEHMQNWARVIPVALATGKLPSLHHPLSKSIPTVAAQDVGQLAAELLAGEPRGIVSIEGPRRVSVLDVARAFSNVSRREVSAYEVPRDEWPAMLLRAGLGADHAQLIIDLYDTHNAGRIDVEEGIGERRFGTTELAEVMASMLPDNAALVN